MRYLLKAIPHQSIARCVTGAAKELLSNQRVCLSDINEEMEVGPRCERMKVLFDE